ncbi:MAG: ATP cone domain-containing protein [Patescibacteria group bacterium]
MASIVIKKDGSKVPFDEEKLKQSIRLSAREAGLPEDRVIQLVEQASGEALKLAATKEEVASSELRSKIFSVLGNVDPSVIVAWKKHDAEKAEKKA